ncbi:MAG: (S)-2-hydroxyglutarate dehydrogenase [Actinoplanes sp.]|nr:(S)-2-hydroxyglutarate dehydrogenase [Actinoplanes sp.]
MRVGVVGAGIVGLAVARELSRQAQVTVVDKEDRVGAHQTSHNSGVAHAGLYYPPGSLKAELCRRGRLLLAAYCAERGLPYDTCGKLVVARDESEAERLAEIERRAVANQVPGLCRLDPAGIARIEPHARGVAALHSPETAIVDFPAVARAYAEDVRAAGGEIRLGFEVTGINGAAVTARTGERLAFDLLVVCAGLHADRVSRLAGDEAGPAIVPFRGEYYTLRPDRAALVRGLIYPVPDPRYPFLGVHLTKTVRGAVEIGPNAILAGAREGYTWGAVSARDLAEALRWPGMRRLARKHWRTGITEMCGSLSRRAFVARAATYVPELRAGDVVRAGAGVRAQALDADGSMVDDFRIHRVGPVVTVRNAPSPAATSSLAIGEYVARQALAGPPC